jgi:hypothetical protein
MWLLSALLGWIPIIGPIISGVLDLGKRYLDFKVIKYKVDGTVDIEAMKVSADIIDSTKDDIGVRLARDIMIFPVAIWTALLSWDTIWAEHDRDWMWHVAPFPPSVAYLPLAVVGFLLGAVGMTIWRRK